MLSLGLLILKKNNIFTFKKPVIISWVKRLGIFVGIRCNWHAQDSDVFPDSAPPGGQGLHLSQVVETRFQAEDPAATIFSARPDVSSERK